MAKRTGRNARCTWFMQNLSFKTYSVDHKGDDLDTTSFEDFFVDAQGITRTGEKGLTGVEVLDCSADGDWNSINYVTTPPNIYVGAAAGPIQLYPNITDGNFYSLTLARVLSAKHSAPVRQLCNFATSFKSNGTFALPQGTNPAVIGSGKD